MDIFIIREGRQTGPFSEDAVKAFLTEGSARPSDLGWRKGMADWQALSEVLKPRTERAGDPATPPPPAEAASNGANGTNGSAEPHVPATAKQKAFLKYLGAEFGEHLTKQRAALAVSDALETPRLQLRIRKWQDEKLRLHAELFQDEVDYRRANRSTRYLERIETEAADSVKDVTKAHVQVIVEALDKKTPSWESESESALWEHLLPAISEHFPQLVLPAGKARLKTGGGKSAAATRGMATPRVPMPPQSTGTFGAMLRGVVLGVIALGAILAGYHFWQQSQGQGGPQVNSPTTPAPAVSEKTEPQPSASAANESTPKEPEKKEPSVPEPVAPAPEKMTAEAKPPTPSPEAPAAPAPAAPKEPAPETTAMNPEKPAAPAAPAAPEEKPAVPAPAPAPAEPAAMTPPAAPPPPQRTTVRLTQGIGVMLPNGQVSLPAGTVLRFLGAEGPNVRVSWNNNVFFVPGVATDLNLNEPPSAPAGTAPAPGTPAAPKKPSEDL